MLSSSDKKEISEAIRLAEGQTSGQIRVHVKKKCVEDVLAEAKKVFLKLKMHHTKKKNGVLIFIALNSRRFAILGDSGIHEKVGSSFWDETRDKMTEHFLNGRMKQGILAGVLSAGQKLKEHFPHHAGDRNELADQVTGS